MVVEDNALYSRFKPSDVTREIVNRLDKSALVVKSADANVVGGTKAIGIFIDELWLFGKKLQAANILSEATGSQASRPEGFVIYATTQSDDQPAGVFKQKLKYFRGVRDGKIDDPTSLPLIYEYPEAMVKAKAYQDRATWYIPNPSLGKSVDETWLITKFAQKQQEGPGELSLFVAKHFNVEAGLGLKSDDWVGANHWEAAADPALTLDELLERSEVVTAGIDGGGLDDLLGLAILGRERDTRRWLLWVHAWAHPTVLERRTDIATKLKDYEQNGDLTLIDEVGEDVEQVCQILDRVNEAGLFPEKDGIGVDPAGITEIVDALELRGFSAGGEGGEDANIVAIKQGWTLTMTIKTVERKLAGKKFVHAGTPLMNWCVSNAKVVPAGNAITITKQAAGSAKIDPLMATFDAAACMARNPQIAATYLDSEHLILL
jgi:phage terminase large subunit-like protein